MLRQFFWIARGLVKRMSNEIYNQQRNLKRNLKRLEVAHFEVLLSGNLDDAYIESCSRTVEQEAAIGMDSRLRSVAGNQVFQAAMRAFARRYRFSPGRLVECATVVSRLIALDVTNAMALHRELNEAAAAARRKAIDVAIADFATAIGGVVDAIKDASASLSGTCGTMQQVADDAFGRMASASSAAADTSQRVDAAGAATEELSQSIEHIGQQATRGLQMAQTAVADTRRTQQAIRSLEEAAERIGSVIGLISTTASQTNVLALNATIEVSRAGDAGEGFAAVDPRSRRLPTRPREQQRTFPSSSPRDPARDQALGQGDIIDRRRHRGAHPKLPARLRPRLRSRAPPTREIAGSMRTTAGSTARAKRSGPKMARFWLACLAKLPVMPSPSRAPRSSSCGSPASRTD